MRRACYPIESLLPFDLHVGAGEAHHPLRAAGEKKSWIEERERKICRSNSGC